MESVEDPEFISKSEEMRKGGEDERTGYLMNPDPEAFASAILRIIYLSPQARKAVSERAKKRAKELFSLDAMSNGVEEALMEALRMGGVLRIWEKRSVLFVIAVLVGILLGLVGKCIKGEL